jgi:hypothetical protein
MDGIHMVLFDREEHLQNLQELATMQSHKLAVLQRRCEGFPAPPPDDTKRDGPIPETRGALEDQFLDAIGQREEPPKTRRRRT